MAAAVTQVALQRGAETQAVLSESHIPAGPLLGGSSERGIGLAEEAAVQSEWTVGMQQGRADASAGTTPVHHLELRVRGAPARPERATRRVRAGRPTEGNTRNRASASAAFTAPDNDAGSAEGLCRGATGVCLLLIARARRTRGISTRVACSTSPARGLFESRVGTTTPSLHYATLQFRQTFVLQSAWVSSSAACAPCVDVLVLRSIHARCVNGDRSSLDRCEMRFQAHSLFATVLALLILALAAPGASEEQAEPVRCVMSPSARGNAMSLALRVCWAVGGGCTQLLRSLLSPTLRPSRWTRV